MPFNAMLVTETDTPARVERLSSCILRGCIRRPPFIPCLACWGQNSLFLVPSTPYDTPLSHPGWQHWAGIFQREVLMFTPSWL